MKISVVIPAYNAAATIEKVLRSCKDQTYPAFEIIVVNDCSTDNTASVVNAFDQGIRLINLGENSGVSHARNTGWLLAAGDIIAFLDSDDEWHPDKLKVIAYLFEKYPQVDAFVHLYGLRYDVLPDQLNDIPVVTKSFISLLKNSPVQGSCISVRRQMPVRFNESYRYCEDHEWALRIAHHYDGYHLIPVTLTRLSRPQLSQGGLSGNKWKMRKGEIRMYSSVVKYRPLFFPVIPFLIVFSLLKYLRKKIG